MEYIVLGSDGKEYGPTSLDTLEMWVQDNRLARTTMLKEVSTGAQVQAGSISGLFPNQPPVAAAPAGNWSQPPAASPSIYPRPGLQDAAGPSSNISVLISAIVRAVVAVALFFVFHGLGLIVAGYGLVYANRAKAAGDKYGPMAVAISTVALVLVALGWIMRLKGTPV